MLKSTSVLTLLLALGVFSAGSIMTNFKPLGATVANAESDNDSYSVIENDDFDDNHASKSSEYIDDDSEESDDIKAVGTGIGPVFNEGAASDPTCKEPACKIK